MDFNVFSMVPQNFEGNNRKINVPFEAKRTVGDTLNYK